MIEQGLIGALRIWLSGGIGNEWSPDRIVARTPWRHRKLEAGGGGAIDIGVHLFHMIRTLMGPVQEISAYARTLEPERFERDVSGRVTTRVQNDVEDVFLANMRFANGAIGSTFWSWSGHGEPTGLAADPVIYGSTGCLKGGEVVLDSGFRGSTADVFGRGATPEQRQQCFPGGITDPFALEMLDFLNAIGQKRPMEASDEEGVLDLATAFTVLESAAINQPVSVADVLDGSVASYQEEINDHYGI